MIGNTYIFTIVGRFIIYQEGDLAMTLMCMRVDLNTGRCLPGLAAMYIMSRRINSVDSAALQRLLAVVDGGCVPREDLIRTPHHVECDTRRVKCSAQNLQPQRGLDMRLVSIALSFYLIISV